MCFISFVQLVKLGREKATHCCFRNEFGIVNDVRAHAGGAHRDRARC